MRKSTKKVAKTTVGFITMVAVTGSILAGCSGKKGTEMTEVKNESSQADDSQEEMTLTFWDGNWQEAVWPQVEEIWNKEHPNIKIEAEFQADLANDKYMLALTNKTAPDVMSCALDWVTTLYGLPFRSETYTLFYNKDLLAEAGYTEAPKTWDEVKEIAAACTKDGVYGYGLCGTNYSNFSFQYITMLGCSGGTILTEDNSASALSSDVAVKTAQLYKDLMAYAPTSVLENDNVANRTLFASGKIAMYLSGIYDVEEIVKMNPDLNFACAMVPVENDAERSTILGGWSVAVAGCSERQEAAWEFVKFLTRPDIAAIYTNTFTGTGTVAARYAGYPEEIVKANADALEFAHALPSVKNIVGIRQAIMDDLQLMLTDDTSAEEACALLDQSVNELLK